MSCPNLKNLDHFYLKKQLRIFKMGKQEKNESMSLKKIINVCVKRGFNPRRVYIYDDTVIFIDLGQLWIYVSSSLVVKPSGDFPILHADPIPVTDESERSDNELYDQVDRIASKSVYKDGSIVKDKFIYTGVRRRKWKIRKRQTLGFKIAVDLRTFMSKKNLYTKPRVSEAYLSIVMNIPVLKEMRSVKEEYAQYIDIILDKMQQSADEIKGQRRQIRDIRDKAGNHLKFVSVDITAAHSVSKIEKDIRQLKADQLYAKTLLKEAMTNMVKFALESEDVPPRDDEENEEDSS